MFSIELFFGGGGRRRRRVEGRRVEGRRDWLGERGARIKENIEKKGIRKLKPYTIS